jgi:hypothetical protein
MMAKPKRNTVARTGANVDQLLQEHADGIRVGLERTVEAILDTGRALLAARAAFPHGQWERIFVGHPEAIATPVPFSVSTAKRLMLVAEHKILSNRAHVHALPPAWGTLYELTKLPDLTLIKALDGGVVRPDIERGDAIALQPERSDRPRSKAVEPGDQYERLRAAITLLGEALEEIDHAVAAKTIDRPEAIAYYRGIIEMAAELAALATKRQMFAQRQVGLLLAELETQPLEPPALAVRDAGPARTLEFHCTSCGRELTEDEIVTVRQCSAPTAPTCEETFDGSDGRNCPACNRPFSRVVTYEGCPDCLEENSVERVHAGMAETPA